MKSKQYFGDLVHYVHLKAGSMIKSRLVLFLIAVSFLSSCNRYITTYEAAHKHNKCGKMIK